MVKNNFDKALEYIVWAGLIATCFVPLFVKGTYYFPFVVFKTLIFRVVVAIIFLAYLWLAFKNEKYRIKLSLPLILFGTYIVVVFASSIMGGNFYFSFWGNNERSEGLLLLLHLLIYLIVLIGFLQPLSDADKDNKLCHTKKWLIIFDASFLCSILVSILALGQYLHWGWIMKSSGGERLASTMGNAGYVAGYLIFNILFGLLLWFLRENKWLRWYYVLGILLHIFIVFNTLTRGGIIALVLALGIFAYYFIFSRFRDNRKIIGSTIILSLLMVGLVVSMFINKNTDWVQKNIVFERVTSISINAVTAQNRLMTWDSAYKGFKEKPILGYGYENFYKVFDKYFNAKIYRKAGSVVWFDRAHNIIFDRLITGGLIGLLLYLSFLFLPVAFMWRYFKKNTESNNLVLVIFSLIILAYFIQNLFIFEALVTYIPLFITIGFLSYFCPSWGDKLSNSFKPYLSLLIILLIGSVPLMFIVNINPALANKSLIKSIVLSQEGKSQEAYDQFIKTIEMNTYGNQEYRQHFGEFVAGIINVSDVDYNFKNLATTKVEEEFDIQIKEKPYAARNYLMFMRFLNQTYQFNLNRLDKSFALFEEAIRLSPTRPMTYHEVAYSHIYLGRYYEEQGKIDEAEQHYNMAIDNLQKGIEINNQVVDSYVNMGMALMIANKPDQVIIMLDKMDDLGIDYRTVDTLERLSNTAVHAKQYGLIVLFYEELTEIVPNKPDYWTNLALAYAYLGDNQKAISTAEYVTNFGGNYAQQSELFINDVLSGKFKDHN